MNRLGVGVGHGAWGWGTTSWWYLLIVMVQITPPWAMSGFRHGLGQFGTIKIGPNWASASQPPETPAKPSTEDTEIKVQKNKSHSK